jgi:hypothetical protein
MIVNPLQRVLLVALLLHTVAVHAQPEPTSAIPASGLKALTMDGRQVLLKADNTWEFVALTQGDPSMSAVLSVTRIWDMDEACKLQFRLRNNLGYRISTLVPRMSVQNLAGVIYDSKSISFASLKPTTEKYTEVQFSGIGCKDIARVKVYDAARCNMGDIDQWNEKEGECLGHLYVEPSELINISK